MGRGPPRLPNRHDSFTLRSGGVHDCPRPVRPTSTLSRAKLLRGLGLRRIVDFRPLLEFRRLGLCACCCATLTSPAEAQTKPTQEPPPAPAPAPSVPAPSPSQPAPFVPEILPIGSDVEEAQSGWKSVLGSVNKDLEGPSLRAGSVVSGGGFAPRRPLARDLVGPRPSRHRVPGVDQGLPKRPRRPVVAADRRRPGDVRLRGEVREPPDGGLLRPRPAVGGRRPRQLRAPGDWTSAAGPASASGPGSSCGRPSATSTRASSPASSRAFRRSRRSSGGSRSRASAARAASSTAASPPPSIAATT